MLTSRIHAPSPSDREPEDIFQSSLATLFTDDIQNSHGSPGGTLVYESPYFGEIKIHLPKHPDLNAERQLFAHYLWNAGILVADFIEQASHCVEIGIEHASTKSGQGFWNVRGERVLELGAGTALPSVTSIICAASEVCITDHPSSPALSSGAIEANAHESLELAKRRKSCPEVSINPFEWGSVTDAFAQENCNHFTKIVAADCLWIPSQHRNLARSIAHFLSKETPDACALIVAGFHTGRHIVADFFRQFPTSGGSGDTLEKLSIAEIYEIDMHGVRRHWLEYRPNEAKEEANKWCVVAVVVRG